MENTMENTTENKGDSPEQLQSSGQLQSPEQLQSSGQLQSPEQLQSSGQFWSPEQLMEELEKCFESGKLKYFKWICLFNRHCPFEIGVLASNVHAAREKARDAYERLRVFNTKIEEYKSQPGYFKGYWEKIRELEKEASVEFFLGPYGAEVMDLFPGTGPDEKTKLCTLRQEPTTFLEMIEGEPKVSKPSFVALFSALDG